MSYYDDVPLPTPFVPHRDIPFVDDTTRPFSGPAIQIIPMPPTAPVEVGRGRSRSRSHSRSRSRSRSPLRSRSPRRQSPPRVYVTRSRQRSLTRSRSRSSSPRYRDRCSRRRNDSPGCIYIDAPRRRRSRSRSRSLSPIPAPQIIAQPSQPPIFVMPPPPRPISPPSPSPWYTGPPSVIWPSQYQKVPVDILTFHYNKNMAYAPAAKTYEEAIDIVVELWPELREVERDRIRLLVAGSDHLVRVPRMTWSAVLCDVPRYEVVHVQVEEQPPPPQYQGKGKGKWGSSDEKGRRSSGLFASIKRIFFG